MGPDLHLHPLHRSDGSALFATPLYTVLAGLNGPVEASRRDELPDAATLEITVRPASGVPGPRERWLETVLHSALRDLLLVHALPRTLLQLTLQVVREPEGRVGRGVADRVVLPVLFNAAVAAALDAGLPMRGVGWAGCAVVGEGGEVKWEVDEGVVRKGGMESVHAMAFDREGGQLLVEVTGEYEEGKWREVEEGLRRRCLEKLEGDEDGEAGTVKEKLRDRAEKAAAWREKT